MKKNNEFFSEIVVGAFMLAVLALLFYFTIVISGVDLFMGRSMTTARIAFPEVGGLKVRDNVVYRGMKVGSVDAITLAPTSVLVTVHVAQDVVLRETYRISVSSHSLLGGNFLELEEGAGAQLALEGTLFRGEPPLNWMRDIGEIARQLRTLTQGDGVNAIVTNLAQASEKVNRLVARVERGEGTVGQLLSSDDALYRDLSDTVAGARATFSHAAAVAARLEKGEGMIGRLLSADDALYLDVSNTFSRVASIAERLAGGEGTMGKLLSGDDTLYRDLKASVESIRSITAKLDQGDGLLARLSNDKALADNASSVLAHLSQVSERLAKGEGTLGKLARDAALYDEISALIKDVRQIVDIYRDTTPISTFAGLIGGAL